MRTPKGAQKEVTRTESPGACGNSNSETQSKEIKGRQESGPYLLREDEVEA